MKKTFKLQFSEYKKLFKKLNRTLCPALQNEYVYYNNQGFNHIISKHRRYRSVNDAIRRICLLSFVESIIKETHSIHSYRISKSLNSIARFWEIQQKKVVAGELRTVSVILRKINEGNIHFFSVFDSK